jgi:transcription-repair coupling factor (superfamily II helicase)
LQSYKNQSKINDLSNSFYFCKKTYHVEISTLLNTFAHHSGLGQLKDWISSPENSITLKGLSGSAAALTGAAAHGNHKQLFVLGDKEDAAYFYHDLVQLLGEEKIFFLPSTYKRSPEFGQPDSNNTILRTEALEQLQLPGSSALIVTHAEALLEKVPTRQEMTGQSMTIRTRDNLDPAFVEDFLQEISFQRVDFVYEPGQYSLRGSIIDIYSFSNEDPVRVDFFGDEVESIRTFNIENQLSKKTLEKITLLPDIGKQQIGKEYTSLHGFLDKETRVWMQSPHQVFQKIEEIFLKVEKKHHQEDKVEEIQGLPSPEDLVAPSELKKAFETCPMVIWGSTLSREVSGSVVEFSTSPQPVFKKNFDLLEQDILSRQEENYNVFILSDNPRQLERLNQIFEDRGKDLKHEEINHALHEGFIDHDLKICIYTDHQIFDRYHKFSLRTDKVRAARQSLSIKELTRLNPGDYVVHIDHGVGKFGGLVTSEVNGQKQEAIKLIYRDNDVILVNIHSLHRISKFKGKDGEVPK